MFSKSTFFGFVSVSEKWRITKRNRKQVSLWRKGSINLKNTKPKFFPGSRRSATKSSHIMESDRNRRKQVYKLPAREQNECYMRLKLKGERYRCEGERFLGSKVFAIQIAKSRTITSIYSDRRFSTTVKLISTSKPSMYFYFDNTSSTHHLQQSSEFRVPKPLKRIESFPPKAFENQCDS